MAAPHGRHSSPDHIGVQGRVPLGTGRAASEQAGGNALGHVR